MPQQFHPNSEMPQQSTVPAGAYPRSSAPPERQIPSPAQEVPQYSRENPSREMMSPGQMGHPGIPAGQEVRPQSPALPPSPGQQQPPGQQPDRTGNGKKDHGQ